MQVQGRSKDAGSIARARRRAAGGHTALAGALFACALGSALPPARADDATGTEAVGPTEEILVTARRRDERLADAPLAVTVETGEQLKDQDAVLFDDIARDVPNLRMMPSPQSSSAMDVTLRGQTAIRAAVDYDPAVGIYVDGVYIANGQAAMNTLLDIDSVEIVRGAQGTLFGRDNTGGSISFRTNRPQLGVTSAEVASDTGNYRMFMGRGILNVPFGDTVAVRVAFQDNEREGYGSSLDTGESDFENQHRYQARIGALWRPNADFDAYWTYEHFEANEVGALLHPLSGTEIQQIGAGVAQIQSNPQVLQAYPQLAGVAPVLFPSNIYQTDAGFPSHDRTYLDATQLTMTQAVDERIRAKLILAYRHLNNDTAIDVDASSLPFADTDLTNSSNQKSAEFQLAGTTIDNRFDWVGGLYWYHDDGSAPSSRPPPSAVYQTLFTLIGLPYSPYQVQETNSIINVSTAAYVHGEYHITEKWAMAAGVRRTDDERRLDDEAFASTPAGPTCTITGTNLSAPCPPIDKSVSFSYWSWEYSTRYRLTEDLNAYFRTGRAQRSGGWNVPVNTPSDLPFKPEELTDYEIGMKSDLFGGAAMLNGDLFIGNYDDMQRLLPREVGGTPTTFVINAGRARVAGAELEGLLRVSRAWTLNAGLGWTDAYYREFEYDGVNETGNRFYQTPRFNAGLGAGYETRVAQGALRVHADYSWQDSIQFNCFNDFNNQGAYGTLNARAVYAFEHQGAWEIAVFGTNLTGREYALTGGSVASAPPPTALPPAMSWQIPGAPRMYGIGFTYRFGSKS